MAEHRETRPWGGFVTYAQNRPCTVKVLTVLPGETLSLQRHAHRTELWVVLDDGVEVEIDGVRTPGVPGAEFEIPVGSVHRARGTGELPARILEISLGEFDEDDIERLSDVYGRA